MKFTARNVVGNSLAPLVRRPLLPPVTTRFAQVRSLRWPGSDGHARRAAPEPSPAQSRAQRIAPAGVLVPSVVSPERNPSLVSRVRGADAHAAALHGEDALAQDRGKTVASWLDHDRTCEGLLQGVRDRPAGAEGVPAEWTRPEKNLRAIGRWCGRPGSLLADALAVLADGSRHKPHLSPMIG